MDFKVRSLKADASRAITAIIIGAGSRGTTYGKYALQFPDTMKIVGVADANNFRKKRTAKAHSIAAQNCFDDWQQVFAREKFADAVIIATPDNLHYEPCMKALAMGYDVLLEKPPNRGHIGGQRDAQQELHPTVVDTRCQSTWLRI